MIATEKEAAATAKRIRRAARRKDILSCCQTIKHCFAEPWRIWWFGDYVKGLRSPGEGLTDDQALSWLQEN